MSQGLKIREYLKNNILLVDGAMGTYYSQLTGADVATVEMANIANPNTIFDIHRAYINAGAKLIRTNTFAANTRGLQIDRATLKELVAGGYKLARKACNDNDLYIAADIGPIPGHTSEFSGDAATDIHAYIIDEYKFIIDSFLENGAEIFCFETFSNADYLEDITQYLKDKNQDAFTMAQFSLLSGGMTRSEISAAKIIAQVKKIKSIDAFGFNCGTGPTHLYNNLRQQNLNGHIVSALPNAGFPEVVSGRTVYTSNADYFADIVLTFRDIGVKIIGGCCGTTPLHIKKIAEKLQTKGSSGDSSSSPIYYKPRVTETNQPTASANTGWKHEKNSFASKLRKNDFVIAVELDPPSDHNIEKLLLNADNLKKQPVDLITISDSPLAKMRVNSIMIASKIKRETGIETMPHICCRDRNSLALKSDILAAYIEDIRNVLLVTGDPIPALERNNVKGIFNLNSFQLIELVREMNEGNFTGDPVLIGGALNANAVNKELELARMYRKIKSGANFFLTQPVFDEATINFLSGIKKSPEVKILAGILPIVSFKNALFLNNEIPGIHIPEIYVKVFKENMPREEAEQAGIAIAVETIKKLRGFVDGLYLITPFNRVNMITKIVEMSM